MELRETTQTILKSAMPAVLLRLADKYIESYNEMRESFVLPREHVILLPIIEVFHDNLGDFVEYIKAIRNNLSGVVKTEVHEFYRTISTRYVQQVRRKRAERSLESLSRMIGRQLEPDEKVRVVKMLEKHWGARRTAMLKRAAEDGDLTVNVRAKLLVDFWKQIDKEIDEGDLPMFKF
jgi:hypothetical protein